MAAVLLVVMGGAAILVHGATRERRLGILDGGVPPRGATTDAPTREAATRETAIRARGFSAEALTRLVGSPVRAVRPLIAEDGALLHAVFGIDDPTRLYTPVDDPAGVLRYLALPLWCLHAPATAASSSSRACRPVAVRVGLAAPRLPGETWDAFVTRVARGGTRAWRSSALAYHDSLTWLAPAARRRFAQLLRDARARGFRVHVRETYRSPERQALLLSREDGRTATATSVHSYGRAVDLEVGDGLLQRAATVREWIAFRRWVVRYRGGLFRVVGTPERTWDWPHVELAAPTLGYRSVDALVAAARACRTASTSDAEAAARCTLPPFMRSLPAARPRITTPDAQRGPVPRARTSGRPRPG